MSNFIPESNPSSVSPGAIGAVSGPPSDQDRALAKRILRPELMSEELLAFIVDYLGVNQPLVPISQISGFAQFAPQIGPRIATSESTSSATYVDLATVGPIISNVPAGKYVILYACYLGNSTSWCSVKYGTAEATDADGMNSGLTTFSWNAVLATLADPSNTVKLRYRSSSGSSSFRDRSLVIFRYANL